MTRLAQPLWVSFVLTTLAQAALAVPVTLTIDMDPDENGFGFSYLHAATSGCQAQTTVDEGSVQFCRSGDPLQALSGTLSADLSGTVLTNIMGTIVVDGGPDIVVTDGTIDFVSTVDNEFGSNELVTSTHGTFSFLDRAWNGAANSFDGSDLRLWGNNWKTGTPGDPSPFPRWGIDLGASVTIIPEPATAMLLGIGLGGFALRRRLSRRDRAR